MLAVIQATDIIVGLLKEREQTKQNERLREVVSLAKSKLEAELFRDVFLADSLATVITIDPPDCDWKLDLAWKKING